MSVFECKVKVGHVGFFIIGVGEDGPKKYGDHFIPLSHEHTLPAFERMGYEYSNAYVSDTIEEYIK